MRRQLPASWRQLPVNLKRIFPDFRRKTRRRERVDWRLPPTWSTWARHVALVIIFDLSRMIFDEDEGADRKASSEKVIERRDAGAGEKLEVVQRRFSPRNGGELRSSLLLESGSRAWLHSWTKRTERVVLKLKVTKFQFVKDLSTIKCCFVYNCFLQNWFAILFLN